MAEGLSRAGAVRNVVCSLAARGRDGDEGHPWLDCLVPLHQRWAPTDGEVLTGEWGKCQLQVRRNLHFIVISLSFVILYESNKWQMNTLPTDTFFCLPLCLGMSGTADTGTGDVQTELKSAHAVNVY